MIANEIIWQPVETDSQMSDLEATYFFQVCASGLPRPEYNVRLIPGRRFHCDFVWRELRLVVEIEGGTYKRKRAKTCPVCGETPKGRHTTGSGFAEDCRKYNQLVLLGYRILRFTTEMVRDGSALELTSQAFVRS